MKKIFLGIAVSVLCLSGTVWGKNLPNVKILAVGGTIAGVASTQEQSTSYKAGQLTVQTLIESVPAMKKLARITGEQYCNIGSGNLTDNDILGLAKRVDSVLKAPETDAVVITHGTDTLEETAWLLNLTVHSDKPIVLVGAMRPATAISADGPANLLNAVRCAASEEAIGQGALIVMNEEIHNARDVTKTDTKLQSCTATWVRTPRWPEQPLPRVQKVLLSPEQGMELSANTSSRQWKKRLKTECPLFDPLVFPEDASQQANRVGMPPASFVPERLIRRKRESFFNWL